MDPYKRLSIVEVLSHPWTCGPKYGARVLYANALDRLPSQQSSLNAAVKPDINATNINNLCSGRNPDERLCQSDLNMIVCEQLQKQINEKALQQLESFGYDREQVIASLQAGEINHATATYQLLLISKHT